MDQRFIVIEYDILLNNNLSHSDKIVYGVISALSQSRGYCYSTNKHLCELVGIKTRQLNYCLARLKFYSYITVEFENGNRKIIPTIQKFIESRESNNKNQNKEPMYDYDWLNESEE